MNKMKKRLVLNISIFLLATGGFLGLFSGCSDLADVETPTAEKGIRVYLELPFSEKNDSVNSDFASARSAVPSSSAFGNGTNHLVFAAALHASGETATLKEASYTPENGSTPSSVLIPFEISSTARTGYVLDIYAFATGYDHSSGFTASDALLFGQVTGINISSNVSSLSISDPIKMKRNVANTTTRGSVELAISIPAGYSLACNNSNFSCTASSIAASSIAHGEYNVTFYITKNGEPVYVWSEMIYVYPGLKTDTWNTGAVNASGAREISSVTMESTFFVRGDGGSWFAANMSGAADGDDSTGNGSLGKPYATMQKVIERIKAINDTTTEYTIYVDGTVTASGSTPVANFTGITSGCSIAIKGLNATAKATLDGNNTARVIVAGTKAASLNLNLTLDNLIITKGKYSGGRGGGISICSTGGNTYKIQNCKIINCAADYGAGIYHEKGRLSFTNCEISGNNASNHSGGGVYSGGSANAAVTFANTKIESNTAQNGGGIFIGGGSKATISDGTVTIKSNVATRDSSSGSGGQGICVWEGILELKGGAKIDSSNNIRLMSGESDTAPHLKITGTLTETGTVATIWPRSYTSGTVVLEADDAALITANYNKFALSDTSTYEICPDSATPTQAILTNFITIATAADFTTELNSNPNANIKLAADIDISGNSTLCTTTPFNGIIDGNGHTITISADNQFADANSGDFAVCIFGKIGSNGVIKNLTVSSSDIAVGSGAAFGGICKDNNGTIENCTNNINFSSSESTRDVGGICINNNGTIKNCTNNGNLALTTSTGWGNCPNVGGIAATNAGTIENCTNNGTLVCNQNLGPIVGRKDSGTVTGCTDNKGITVKGSGR